MKFKVNPLFFALALALIAFGHALEFVCTMLALLFHESAHALMARARGYVVKKMVLLPYGAMMSAGENFDTTSSVLIGLLGPLCHARSFVVVFVGVSLYDFLSLLKFVALLVQSLARVSSRRFEGGSRFLQKQD